MHLSCRGVWDRSTHQSMGSVRRSVGLSVHSVRFVHSVVAVRSVARSSVLLSVAQHASYSSAGIVAHSSHRPSWQLTVRDRLENAYLAAVVRVARQLLAARAKCGALCGLRGCAGVGMSRLAKFRPCADRRGVGTSLPLIAVLVGASLPLITPVFFADSDASDSYNGGPGGYGRLWCH